MNIFPFVQGTPSFIINVRQVVLTLHCAHPASRVSFDLPRQTSNRIQGEISLGRSGDSARRVICSWKLFHLLIPRVVNKTGQPPVLDGHFNWSNIYISRMKNSWHLSQMSQQWHYIKWIRTALESLSALTNNNINCLRNIENRAAARISVLNGGGGGVGWVGRCKVPLLNSQAQLEVVVVPVYLLLIFGQLLRPRPLPNVAPELLLKS